MAVSFVCCVEAGLLEEMTIRLVESLRRWGGAFADAQVFAVVARHGPALHRRTLDEFKRLNVLCLNEPSGSHYEWFPYYNKPVALAAVEKISSTDLIAWLDSDMLVVREPSALNLEPCIDFAACPSAKEMGTTGPGDPFEALWQANCRTLGIDIETLPWVLSDPEKLKMRVYWNSGIFVYRRETKFGQRFLDTCTALMDANNVIDSRDFNISFNEMGAVALAMHAAGLKWKELPPSYNHNINKRSHERLFDETAFRSATVIHYHDSMLPDFWENFLMAFGKSDVADWLTKLGPLKDPRSRINWLRGKALGIARGRKRRAYAETSKTPATARGWEPLGQT